MTDEPLRPALASPAAPTAPPWRPTSILYPAIFGGPLAATVLGVWNGRRLALPARSLAVIAVAGVAAVLARWGLTRLLHEHGMTVLLGLVTGAAVWLVVVALQRARFRATQPADTEPASLVRPGITVAVGCGLLEAVALGLAVS